MSLFTSVLLFATVGSMGVANPGTASALPRSRPEEQGIAPAAIREFVEAADAQIDTMNSVMIVRHGKVVAEGWWSPYDAESPHMLYSLSKSFTSTAAGLAAAEGKLSVDDTVLSFFPDDAPSEPSNNLKAMRVRDLLRMATGHQAEPNLTGDAPWTRTFLAQPVPFKPGSHFLYNTSATYMLSAIVQKTTGQTVLDYLRPRLFEPLGIEHPTWGTSPQGVSLGGFGLSIRTEDIARFGQLYLQKGVWEGRQLVPAAWVEAATSLQVSNGSNPNSDWDQGYGYQFWRSRHGAYRGDGAFGQFCIVMPEQDAVVAITSGCRDMQAVLNLVWDRLLPAMKDAPLPADDPEHEALERTLAGLAVHVPSGSSTSALASSVSGKRFSFPSNARQLEAASLEFGAEGATMVLKRTHSEDRISCGAGTWRKGRAALPTGREDRPAEQPIAAAGAWTADDTYTVKLCQYETPFYATLAFHFEDDKLTLDTEMNVAFGPTKLPKLEGTTEGPK
jgi:CubicO group peptidase (beta-lactamase class C family)